MVFTRQFRRDVLNAFAENASSLATEVGGNLQRFYAKPR
jgi:hypothetical protein